MSMPVTTVLFFLMKIIDTYQLLENYSSLYIAQPFLKKYYWNLLKAESTSLFISELPLALSYIAGMKSVFVELT